MISFKRPKNQLELHGKAFLTQMPEVPDEMWSQCPNCKTTILSDELVEQGRICPKCNYHFKLNARERIEHVCDKGTFLEFDADLASADVIEFPGYEKKLRAAQLASSERDAVVTGCARIGGLNCVLFVMEARFMMGSMGAVVGEKITKVFEHATEKNLPVVGFTVSGGARMQEGIFSLMQMAKVSGAVKRHSDAGGLYIVILTDPTTGGVSASFAMEGDIILAEPGALVAFAGPRVIEQTLKQKLPEGFQRSEFLLEHGFIDDVIDRRKQKTYLARLLAFHMPAQDPAEQASPPSRLLSEKKVSQ